MQDNSCLFYRNGLQLMIALHLMIHTTFNTFKTLCKTFQFFIAQQCCTPNMSTYHMVAFFKVFSFVDSNSDSALLSHTFYLGVSNSFLSLNVILFCFIPPSLAVFVYLSRIFGNFCNCCIAMYKNKDFLINKKVSILLYSKNLRIRTTVVPR